MKLNRQEIRWYDAKNQKCKRNEASNLWEHILKCEGLNFKNFHLFMFNNYSFIDLIFALFIIITFEVNVICILIIILEKVINVIFWKNTFYWLNDSLLQLLLVYCYVLFENTFSIPRSIFANIYYRVDGSVT